MKIQEILSFLEESEISFSFLGDAETEVEGFSSLTKYKENSFTWVKEDESIPDNFDFSSVKLVFVQKNVTKNISALNMIRSEASKHAFFSTIEHFYEKKSERPSIGQFSYISPTVKLGTNVHIGHNCTLDGDITIGDGTVIWNNVTIINRVTIGKNCEIQSGTVIGHDGFGYTEDENHVKTMVKHFGGVIIGNNVRLGMNNVIARGTIDDTVIGSGTKMSDLCHIGHNNQIEQNCTIINSALFGSCHIEENAYLSYCVIKNQTHLGKNSFIGMASNVIRDVPDNTVVIGNPAKPLKNKKEK